MINLLMGPPGAGKSYEAVVYHIYEALKKGRKVITNLPVNVDEFDKKIPGSKELIEKREPTLENPRPFGKGEDYGDDWRGEQGIGPLYVIDECHKMIPKGTTSRSVEEWYAEHRHEGADVLLITQSYGKISTAIRDMVQLVYRVRKATALGSKNKYIRKVQDGIRGEVVNENVRTYDPKMFPLYKSHTKSQFAVDESGATDVKPIWKHWSVIGSAVVFPLGLIALFSVGNPMDASNYVQDVKPSPVSHSVSSSGSVPASDPKVSTNTIVSKKEVFHPYGKVQLHINGYIEDANDVYIYSVQASQNGQKTFTLTSDDLIRAGYYFERINPCLAKVKYKDDYTDYLTCGLPTSSVPL